MPCCLQTSSGGGYAHYSWQKMKWKETINTEERFVNIYNTLNRPLMFCIGCAIMVHVHKLKIYIHHPPTHMHVM